jgi:ABC-2 type transport system permease protein
VIGLAADHACRLMLSIFRKEINTFFSSLIGYIVIGTFLLLMGLLVWLFPDFSILDSPYATLDTLFDLAPVIFMFLIPAVTMRTFAEENQSGTIELLVTRPLTDWAIVGGKFFACLTLVVFALVPTALYYVTVHQLGAPPGNLDSGGILGSYIGLLFLAGAFVAIGIFASSLTNNQIVAFILATFLCFFIYLAFDFLSRLPIFFGKTDDLVQALGIQSHYDSISRGVVDTRDVVYFLSVIALFLAATVLALGRRKW